MKTCITCKHRHVYTEKSFRLNEAGEEVDIKAILLPRCLKDKVDKKMPHPFGPESRDIPVLTCREMLLNGCRNFKLWEPIGANK